MNNKILYILRKTERCLFSKGIGLKHTCNLEICIAILKLYLAKIRVAVPRFISKLRETQG